MSKFYIFSILITILLSCAKDGKRIFVEGKVLNPITGEGIKGIRVKIMKDGLSGGYKVLKETFTDADGNIMQQTSVQTKKAKITLPKGVYFLKWINNNGIQTQKVISL